MAYRIRNVKNFGKKSSKKKHKAKIENITESPFINLHVHDEYSIKDGVGRVEDYAKCAKQLGMNALSITNHGSIGQVVRQFESCKALGIKPIFGCEVYVNNKRDELKEIVKEIASMKKNKETDGIEKKIELRNKYRKNNHLVLLAKNKKGFDNLIQIVSDAWINGFYYRPRTDMEFISKHSEGLIALSACTAGEISIAVESNYEEAVKKVKAFKKIFGDDFYIEILFIDWDISRAINKKLIQLAEDTNTKIVITTDSHYIDKDDNKVQDVLLLMNQNKTFKDIEEQKKSKIKKREIWQFKSRDLYYKGYKDVLQIYNRDYKKVFSKKKFDEFVANTRDVESKIENIELDTSFKVPRINVNSDKSSFDILKTKVIEGWKLRKIKDKTGKYKERVLYELKVLKEKNFSDYFLIMHDIIMWAKKQGIIVGPGRGSAASSLVCYLLYITDIDPLQFGLLFERFINIKRKEFPDIDTDFEPSRRDEVKEYIIERFGENRIASIGTYSLFQTRTAIASVSKVFNIPLREVRSVVEKLESDADNMSWEEIYEIYPGVKSFMKKHEDAGRVIQKIRRQIKNISRHAAGIIITNRDIYKSIPIMTQNNTRLTAWQDGSDYHELTKLGFLKFDILGLNNLAVLKDTLMLVKKNHGVDINIHKIPLDDKDAFELVNQGSLDGIFQFESYLARNIAQLVRVSSFNDLCAICSLIRPGSYRAGVYKVFAERKNSNKDFNVHPLLRDILDETYGIIVYQEQIMLIAQKIGGFNLSEANDFRKALFKYGRSKEFESKRIQEVESYKEKFVDNALKAKMTKKDVEDLWDKISEFAAYGFNKAHSVAYTITSYHELYLKAHYPIEFMCALLMNTAQGKVGNKNKLTLYIKSAMRSGIDILKPDINKSDINFSIEGDCIRFGLRAIKGVGSIDKHSSILQNKPYKDFEDFYNRVDRKSRNKRIIEALICSGAFDELGERSELLEDFYLKFRKEKEFKAYTKTELLAKERDVLSVILSANSFNKYKDLYKVQGLSKLQDAPDVGYFSSIIIVSNVREHLTKNKKTMAFLQIEDDTDSAAAIVWPKLYSEFRDLINASDLLVVNLEVNEYAGNNKYSEKNYIIHKISRVSI